MELMISDFGDFKESLEKELKAQAEGFVKVGYLLKVARDNEIVQQAGYTDVYEFAKKEYGIERSTVSRYISINDRYSEGGNSPQLRIQYQEYGYTKLAEMLTLPEAVAEAIPPEVTREEIREIKKAYKEDEKVTPMELMMEGQDEEKTVLQQALFKFFEDNPERFLILKMEDLASTTNQAINESGTGAVSVRVKGIGAVMLTEKSLKNPLTVTIMRQETSEDVEWEEVEHQIRNLYRSFGEDGYKMAYGKSIQPAKEVEKATEMPKPVTESQEDVIKSQESVIKTPEEGSKSVSVQNAAQQEENQRLEDIETANEVSKNTGLYQNAERVEGEVVETPPENANKRDKSSYGADFQPQTSNNEEKQEEKKPTNVDFPLAGEKSEEDEIPGLKNSLVEINNLLEQAVGDSEERDWIALVERCTNVIEEAAFVIQKTTKNENDTEEKARVRSSFMSCKISIICSLCDVIRQLLTGDEIKARQKANNAAVDIGTVLKLADRLNNWEEE